MLGYTEVEKHEYVSFITDCTVNEESGLVGFTMIESIQNKDGINNFQLATVILDAENEEILGYTTMRIPAPESIDCIFYGGCDKPGDIAHGAYTKDFVEINKEMEMYRKSPNKPMMKYHIIIKNELDYENASGVTA